MTPNIHYEKREIVGERLELKKGPIYWLGPDLTVRDSTVIISAAGRSLVPMGGQFINCTIQAKGQLMGVVWAQMTFKGCRFKGRFRGNEFGFREALVDTSRFKPGGLEDCDFSEAELHGVGFNGCDMSTIRLPRWPCFTFVDPVRHAAELRQHSWPGLFGRVTVETACESPEGSIASTWHAPTVAEKMETTVEELRAALETAPGIFM
ncbi:pentapeptide repeat-containing protein [Archangium violaceum]|uniref:hypothetical protein n=1 Tax=Archangium violaceum TaxID=83451 RepID=UPI0036DD3102